VRAPSAPTTVTGIVAVMTSSPFRSSTVEVLPYDPEARRNREADTYRVGAVRHVAHGVHKLGVTLRRVRCTNSVAHERADHVDLRSHAPDKYVLV
jgi:uncharacterized protein with von Willebrand factor type A (vWA) domain